MFCFPHPLLVFLSLDVTLVFCFSHSLLVFPSLGIVLVFLAALAFSIIVRRRFFWGASFSFSVVSFSAVVFCSFQLQRHLGGHDFLLL